MIISIIEQSLVALPLVVGAYLILSLMRLPALSLESAYLFGAVSAWIGKDSFLLLAVLYAFLGGVGAALVVSIMHQIFRIPFLISALIANGLFHGLTQWVLNGSVVSFSTAWSIPELAILALIGGGILLPVGLLLRSQIGYGFAIYGNNPHFFRHHQISGCYTLFFGVVLSHGSAGLSGFLFAQAHGFLDLNMGFGAFLLCLASLLLGQILLRKRLPSLFIPIFGVVSYFFMQHLLLRVGLNLKYFNAFQAVFIFLTLILMQSRVKKYIYPTEVSL